MKIPKNRPIKDSRLLAEQAERLSSRILSIAEGDTIGAEENALREGIKALEGDYIRPITRPTNIKPGQIANPDPLNKLFESTKADLDVLMSAGRSLEDALVAGHNVIATKEANLIGELKTLRDKIAVLKLYATDLTDDDLYTAFTFTDGTKIGVPDEGKPLTYEETEGILTLPVVAAKDQEVINISISEGSNGVPGNNFERDRTRNGALEAITDGLPSTMFEYEKVGANRTEPLQLVLRLDLKEPTVINRISIVPANLGTTNWVKVKDIQVQSGQRLISVREDVQSPSWDLSDDPFRLSPAASKYAGQGMYTFKPRLAKAVQITLTQDEPYPILNGRRSRYAIALREIAVQQVEFEAEGAFKLTQQTFQRPVRAIGLIENLLPFDPALAAAEYSVSVDGGESWIDIVSFENKDAAKTEAIALATPSSSIILRGELSRVSEGFATEFNEEAGNLLDRSKVLTGGTISGPIALEAKPQTYLEIIETRYGHAGDYGPKFFLGRASGIADVSQVLELPINFDKEDITLLVNGEEWPRVAAFADENEKGFIYKNSGVLPTITIGDGNASGLKGYLPPAGAELYLKVSKLENPQTEVIPDGYKLYLKYEASKVKESTAVIFRDLKIRQSIQTAGPDTTYIDIPWRRTDINISAMATPETDFYVDGTEVTYQNGETEFENLPAGDYYSVDYEGNRIYLAEPLPRGGGDLTVEYYHTLRELIPQGEWNYANKENAIEVYSNLIAPKRGELSVDAQITDRVLDLDGYLLQDRPYSIIPGSIKGVDVDGVIGISRVLQTEVKYINGSEEFEKLRVVGTSLLGYFSVNYEDNTIYLPKFDGLAEDEKGFLTGKIIWQYISSEVHYNLGRKLELGTEYTYNETTIEPTTYFLDRLYDLSRRLGRSVDLHIRYNIINQSTVDGALLERFYSPVLRDIAIVGISVDPRLGTLESL